MVGNGRRERFCIPKDIMHSCVFDSVIVSPSSFDTCSVIGIW